LSFFTNTSDYNIQIYFPHLKEIRLILPQCYQKLGDAADSWGARGLAEGSG